MRFGILLEALEALGKPAGNRSPAFGGEPRDLLERMDRLDSRHDGGGNAGGARTIDEAKVAVVVEEHLRDGTCRAGVELALEVVDVGRPVGALRVLLGISRDGDIEIAELADAA